MANVDLTPGGNPIALGGPGIHFHNPGQSASTIPGSGSNPSDFPAPPKGGTAVVVKVAGVRFASPS